MGGRMDLEDVDGELGSLGREEHAELGVRRLQVVAPAPRLVLRLRVPGFWFRVEVWVLGVRVEIWGNGFRSRV